MHEKWCTLFKEEHVLLVEKMVNNHTEVESINDKYFKLSSKESINPNWQLSLAAKVPA